MKKSWCINFNQDFEKYISELSKIDARYLPGKLSYNYSDKEVQRLDKFLEASSVIEKSPSIVNKKILIVSNNTYKLVEPHFRLACLQKNIFIEIEDIGYGDPVSTLLNMSKSGALKKFDYVLVNLDENYYFNNDDNSHDSRSKLSEGILKLHQIKDILESSKAEVTTIIQTLISKTPQISLHYEDIVKDSRYEILNSLNEEILKLRSENCLVLDLKNFNLKIDYKYHYFGKLPFSSADFSLYSDLLASLLFAHLGLTKKVLVLDLDNTLWGGVVGDDGKDGIRIKIGDPLGEAFLDFQKYCKSLSNRGIILCICSKNNLEQAKEPFEELKHLPLSLDDFVVFMANWSNKAENIKTIANKLNLGLESIVFVDDNPAEREIVRQNLPMVSVPEIGSDPSVYAKIITDAGYFSSVRFSESDKSRIQDYKANIIREDLKKQSININDYLKSLEMKAEEIEVNKNNLQRASQMTLKTNQFNTNSVRLNEQEISGLINSKDHLLMQFQLKDKFADNGIVSLVILEKKGSDLEIINWVMSCRVFERGFENYIFNKILILMDKEKLKNINASVIKNEKNKYIHDLYDRLGLKLKNQNDGTNFYINGFDSLKELETFVSDTNLIKDNS